MKLQYPGLFDIYGPLQEKHKDGSRQLDWEELYKFIEANKENINNIKVGLAEDWKHTSGKIWDKKNGYIPHNKTSYHVSSPWATPVAVIRYNNKSREVKEFWILGKEANGYFTFIRG